MKSTTPNKIVDKQNLRRRSVIGFTSLLVFLALSAFGFVMVGNQHQILEAPAFLRGVFEFNARLWQGLQSSTRQSVQKTPPAPGTEPRINGDIGLEEDVPDEYRVVVESGGQKKELTVAEIAAAPKNSETTDFRCVEGWSRVLQYSGVRFSEFMKRFDVGRKPDGSLFKYVGLETPDRKYYVSIDMKSMLHDQTILALEMNEAPLKDENGAPIRLIIPIKYGIKSLKRIGRIFFSDERPPDYWAESGYDWYSGL